ncbi:MAG: hypothetical protein HYS08_01965 [Chlamydiae bacterium]|nr:hypothetical protein [Chlamydiota bacterium]MBI3266591.1 hypothetical protein [Chlamydiota bacterium]
MTKDYFQVKVDDESWMMDVGFLSLVQACVVARFIGQPHKWGDYKIREGRGEIEAGGAFIAHDGLHKRVIEIKLYFKEGLHVFVSEKEK